MTTLFLTLLNSALALAGNIECTNEELGRLSVSQVGPYCTMILVHKDGTRFVTMEKNERPLCRVTNDAYEGQLQAEEEREAKIILRLRGSKLTYSMVGGYSWEIPVKCGQVGGFE